jgi:hypothetical protein
MQTMPEPSSNVPCRDRRQQHCWPRWTTS